MVLAQRICLTLRKMSVIVNELIIAIKLAFTTYFVCKVRTVSSMPLGKVSAMNINAISHSEIIRRWNSWF